MAVKKISKCNGAVVFVNYAAADQSAEGLNLGSKTHGNTVTRQSDDLYMQRPMRGFLVIQLASGSLTAKVLVGAAAAPTDFTSALSTGSMSDTNEHIVSFATSTTNPYITVQTVSGGGGAVVNRAYMVLLDKYNAGGGQHEVSNAMSGLDPARTAPLDYVLTA